ncbi:MAG: hypothetical protein ABIG61_03890 [Planctomycetota bacterium]
MFAQKRRFGVRIILWLVRIAVIAVILYLAIRYLSLLEGIRDW